jgi:poly-beta-hydroxyalkanoate depolymerase
MVVSMDRFWALLPLSLPLYLALNLLKIPASRNWNRILRGEHGDSDGSDRTVAVSVQLLAYMVMAGAAYLATVQLVPNIQQYTLRKGICGKDLGKRGTAVADKPMYVCV